MWLVFVTALFAMVVILAISCFRMLDEIDRLKKNDRLYSALIHAKPGDRPGRTYRIHLLYDSNCPDDDLYLVNNIKGV